MAWSTMVALRLVFYPWVVQCWKPEQNESGVWAESLYLLKCTFTAGELQLGNCMEPFLAMQLLSGCRHVLSWWTLSGCACSCRCACIAIGKVLYSLARNSWIWTSMVTKSPCTKNRNMYHNMYQKFWYKFMMYQKYRDMYQTILIHGYFWYVGPRVPKMWYILHRVPKSMPNFWYTMQYVLKNWYTNLYAELNENIIYFGTHRCVYQKILVHAPCVPKILVHIDSFWYILRCFLVCIGICIIFLVHGFGTRIFWYTNWTNRSPKKVEKLTLINSLKQDLN